LFTMGERTSGREHYVNLRIGGASAFDRRSPSSISDASAIAFQHESALTEFRAGTFACSAALGRHAGAGLVARCPSGPCGRGSRNATVGARRVRFRSGQRAHRSNLDDGSGVPWTYRYTYLAGGVNTGNGWE